MSDANLASLFQTLAPSTIVVLEDIDAIFLPQNKAKAVTFSGLLNALDGIASGEGRILFMTTNRINTMPLFYTTSTMSLLEEAFALNLGVKFSTLLSCLSSQIYQIIIITTIQDMNRISPALIRPGRVDLRVKFDLATRNQIRLMVERFFPHTKLQQSQAIFNPTHNNDLSSSSFSSSSLGEEDQSVVDDTTEYDMARLHTFTIAVMNGVGDHTVSTAQLQDWFIKHIHSKQEVILRDIPRFLRDCKEENMAEGNSWDMMMAMHESPSPSPSPNPNPNSQLQPQQLNIANTAAAATKNTT